MPGHTCIYIHHVWTEAKGESTPVVVCKQQTGEELPSKLVSSGTKTSDGHCVPVVRVWTEVEVGEQMLA